MFKLLLVIPILLLLGCTANKNSYEYTTTCKRINLPEHARASESDYLVPPITAEHKEIIKVPLPPDLSI